MEIKHKPKINLLTQALNEYKRRTINSEALEVKFTLPARLKELIQTKRED